MLREVRKNNKNTLSGLSLDSIAQQVEIIVDTRDMERGGPGAVGVGRDRMKGKVSQNDSLFIPYCEGINICMMIFIAFAKMKLKVCVSVITSVQECF